MTTEPPLDEEALVKKFNWWWRQWFAQSSQQNAAAMVGLLQSWKGSDLGKYLEAITDGAVDTLRPLDRPRVPVLGISSQPAQRTVSAMFEEQWIYSAWRYEVGCRVKGEYEFGYPWIELSLEQKAQLAHRWPDPVVAPSGCKRRSKSAAGGARKVRHLPARRERFLAFEVKSEKFAAR